MHCEHIQGGVHPPKQKNLKEKHTMKTHIEFLDYIEDLAEDIANTTTDREEVYDLVWEYADSSEHVIYYGKAHDLVHLVRNWNSSLYNDAEAELEELTCGGEPMSYDKHATVLAFCIIRLELHKRVEELIEEKEASEEIAEELANA